MLEIILTLAAFLLIVIKYWNLMVCEYVVAVVRVLSYVDFDMFV